MHTRVIVILAVLQCHNSRESDNNNFPDAASSVLTDKRTFYYIQLNDINAASGEDELSIVLSRKGGEVTSNLPITLRAENTEQRTNWLNEFYNCRQLTREELADEREPEFTIVEDESASNKDALCRKSSTERQAKLQKADSKLSNKSFEAEVSDEQVTVVRLANETAGEAPSSEHTAEQQQRKDDVTLEKSESKQDSAAAASSGNPSRQNSKQNSRQNSTKIEEPDESNAKDEIYKRQQSRDSPGLPKPQKSDQQQQKMNSLSRQSTQQELNRRLSASSSGAGVGGEKTPDNVSRQSSAADPKSSSRRSSVDKNSTDKIIDKLADKSAIEPTPIANLSRKSSTKEPEPSDRPKLSREGSRRSSVKRQESKVQEDFQVYEESTSVPLTPDTNGGSENLQRKSSSRKASIDKPKFKRSLSDVTVNSNETVILECELEPCKDQLTLEWLKDGKVLNIAGRYKSSNQNNVYHLQINKAIARDSGQFALTATSPYAQTISTCKVTVKPLERQNTRPPTPDAHLTPSAPVFKIKLKDTELKEGSTVRFELQVQAEPPATLKFFKDDKPLKENDRVKIEYTSDDACEIVIENCKQADAGAYRVEASNSEGKDTTACSVTVSNSKDVFKGLPDEPVDQNHSTSPRSPSPTSEKQTLSTSRMSSNPNSRPRTPAFKWFRDGSEFDVSERFLCQFNEGKWFFCFGFKLNN